MNDDVTETMTETIIKICGIKTSEMLEVAIEAGADIVGFMHFPKSPRHLDIEEIGLLISEARGRVETAVVTVDPDNSLIAEIAMYDPEWLQLHGTESVSRVTSIRAEGGIPVMKVLPVGAAEDVAMVAEYESIADRILLDAKPPMKATRPGGLGVPFDWDLLKALDPELPFMLSGGLTPQNVAEAVTKVQPFGLDVSSGVESTPGEKDAEKIRAFIQNARAAARKA
jgi:phosphoribosylanthranilate isomerase